MALGAGDYRARSYAARARSVSNANNYSKTNISINPNNVVKSSVSGVTQVAIRGNASDPGHFIETSNVQPVQTPADTIQNKPVSPTAKAVFQGQISPNDYLNNRARAENIYISGGVANKLAGSQVNPMSVRDDVSYQVVGSTQNRNILYNNFSGKQNDRYSNLQSPSSNILPTIGSNKLGFIQVSGFEKRIERFQQAEENFYSAPVFKSIGRTSSLITGGSGEIGVNRNFFGGVAEQTVYGVLSAPLAIPGSIYFGTQKTLALGEGVINYPKNTGLVFSKGFSEFESTSGSFLPGGTPINIQGGTSLAGAALGAGIAYPNFKNNFVTRKTLETTYPNTFVKAESTGITFIEDNTVPTSKNTLKSFEGQTVKTIHVTPSDPFKGTNQFITTARPEGAGSFRIQNNLLNFYKSSPEPSGSPRAYLGYAGITSADSIAPSSSKVITGRPTIKLLMFDDQIAPTPSNFNNIRDINAYQASQSGKTFVPAENLAGVSREGQFITPSSYKGISNAADFGLDQTQGSIIQRSGKSTFTFYKQNLPSQNIFGKVIDEVTGRNYYKLELIPTKTLPVSNEVTSFTGLNQYVPESFSKAPIESSLSSLSKSSVSVGLLSVPRFSAISSLNSSKSKASEVYSSKSFNSSVGRSSSKNTRSSKVASYVSSPVQFSSSPVTSSVSKSFSAASKSSQSSLSSTSYSLSRGSSSNNYSLTPSGFPKFQSKNSSLKYDFKLTPEKNKRRDYSSKKIRRYTPSFDALFFKRFGKYKRGSLSKSGLDYRPITGGFKLTSGKGFSVGLGESA